jgi:hypothetical protein
MKKKLLIVAMSIFIMATTNAQLGGLIKKAKDKASQQAPADETKPESSNSLGNSQESNSPHSSKNENQSVVSNNSEVLFRIPDRDEYPNTRGDGVSLQTIQNRRITFLPYDPVKKEEEKGCDHFAKDYPELAAVVTDKNKSADFIVEFSSTPFKNGTGTLTTKFSSSKPFIYAKVKTKNGQSINDAFGFGGKGGEIEVYNTVYNNYSDRFPSGLVKTLFITPEKAKENYFLVDVLTDFGNAQIYQIREDDRSLFIPEFGFMHSQEVFPSSNTYTVRWLVRTSPKDEWGKKTNKRVEAVGFFEYDLKVSDAAGIADKSQTFYEDLKKHLANMPRPVPDVWSMKSSPLTMGYTQAQLIKMYLGENFNNNTLIRFIATNDNGWSFVEDISTGAVIARSSRQVYYAFFKNKAKNTCWVGQFWLQQPYIGSGKYGQAYAKEGEWYNVKCEELK